VADHTESDTRDTRLPDAGSPSASAAPADIGEHIGPYRILKVLGQGGMGVVYLAEQEHPIRRQVALKVIKLGMDTGEVVARFESERQALALMSHEHIARVFDAGSTDQGRPFFAMEFVPGIPLTDYCDRHRLTIAERLGLFAQVCQGVQHAHQKGIIHRDLKPSNILVTDEGGRPVPKIIDFGIAKATDRAAADQTAFTHLGSLVGTPEYMSPEQASMGAVEVDTRTDIYSLGVILYELLVGVLPFEPESLRRAAFGEILRIVREVEPARPSTRISTLGSTAVDLATRRHTEAAALQRELRGDLDWIILKALEKDRARRYASASELAADIERHVTDEPVMASPPSAAYRWKKTIRRHRVAVGAGVAIGAALLVGLIAASAMYLQAQRAREDADRQRAVAVDQTSVARTMYRRAEEARVEADRQRAVAVDQTAVAQTMYVRAEDARLDAEHQRAAAEQAGYIGNITAAGLLLAQNRRDEARTRLAAAPSALRAWEWHYLAAQVDTSLAVLGGDGGAVISLAFTPDGSRLLWTTTLGALHASDSRGEQPLDLGMRPATGPEMVLAATRDGARYLTAPWFGPPAVPPALYIHVDGKPAGQPPASDDAPNVRLFAAARTTMGYPAGVTPYQRPPEMPEALRTLSLRDRATSAVVARLVLPTLGISAPVRLLGDASRANAAGAARDVSQVRTTYNGIQDTADRVLATFGGRVRSDFATSIASAAFSADARRVVVWSWDNVPTVWDTVSGRMLAKLEGHTDGITQVVFGPDGSELVSASHDGTVRLWRVGAATAEAVMTHAGPVLGVAVSPDGTRVVSGCSDGAVRIWNKDGRLAETLKGHQATVTAVAWSPDGRAIASASTDRTVRVWDVASLRERDSMPGHVVGIAALAFSPDGRTLASGSFDGWVRLWNAQRIRAVQPDPSVVADHVFDNFDMSAEAGRVVTAAEKTVGLPWWSIDAPGRVSRVGAPASGAPRILDARVTDVLMSPDGRRVFAAMSSGTIGVWNIDDPKPVQVFRGPPVAAAAPPAVGPQAPRMPPAPAVTNLTLSRDGRHVAASSIDRAIRIWTLGAERPVTIPAGVPKVGGLAFSPDGRHIAGGIEGAVRTWDTEQGALVRQTGPRPGAVISVAYSPDGRWLVAGTRGSGAQKSALHVWDALSGAAVATVESDGAPAAIAFNGTGTRLAAAYEAPPGAAGMPTMRDAGVFQMLQVPVQWPLNVAFTADGTRLVVLAQNGGVTVLDGRETYDLDAWELAYRSIADQRVVADAVRRIHESTAVPRLRREAAERAARALGDSALPLWLEADDLVGTPGQTRGDCQRALEYADIAMSMMPAHPGPIETRGMALFRLGRYEESTAAFRRAVELRGGYQFVDLAFLRMALYRLGRTEEARELEPEMAAYSTRLQGVDRMSPLELAWLRELSLVMAEAEKK